MSSTTPPPAWSLDGLKEIIARHWGFRSLRPLQEQAMRAVLDARDSLVVMPTGGGKSLCYQAPCISHWGHDFRPEYRQLKRLRELFPDASIHAYTATATERVRGDIIAQLGLQDAEVLVGNFDRPNLSYRVLPRHDLMKQVLE